LQEEFFSNSRVPHSSLADVARTVGRTRGGRGTDRRVSSIAFPPPEPSPGQLLR